MTRRRLSSFPACALLIAGALIALPAAPASAASQKVLLVTRGEAGEGAQGQGLADRLQGPPEAVRQAFCRDHHRQDRQAIFAGEVEVAPSVNLAPAHRRRQ